MTTMKTLTSSGVKPVLAVCLKKNMLKARARPRAAAPM